MPRSQSSQRIWWREAEIFLAWNRKKLPRIHRLTGVEFKNFYSSRGGIVCSAAKDSVNFTETWKNPSHSWLLSLVGWS
jgi:hypothetical protein